MGGVREIKGMKGKCISIKGIKAVENANFSWEGKRLCMATCICNLNTWNARTRRPRAFLASWFYLLDEFQAHGRACLNKQGWWQLRNHAWGYPLVSTCRSMCTCGHVPTLHTHRKLQRDSIECISAQHCQVPQQPLRTLGKLTPLMWPEWNNQAPLVIRQPFSMPSWPSS